MTKQLRSIWGFAGLIGESMTKRTPKFIGWVGLVVTLIFWFFGSASAADKPSFSGTYFLQVDKSDKRQSDVSLEVIQSDESIEVTKVVEGKKETNIYPLNGRDGEYLSSGGVSGRCKGQIKGNKLVIESIVVTHPVPAAGPMRIHSREQWQLSGDLKTLTIKLSVDFPDVPAEASNFVGDILATTEIFTRVQTP